MNEDRLDGRLSAARSTLHPARGESGPDLANDIVIALVKKSKRTGVEVRLRDLKPLGRVVLLRLMKQDESDVWWPVSDTCYSGLTIRADLLTRTIDALEQAEDALADAGLLP